LDKKERTNQKITIILNYLALKENKYAINNIETIEEFEKNHTKI
jgi:hypothetical protein